MQGSKSKSAAPLLDHRKKSPGITSPNNINPSTSFIQPLEMQQRATSQTAMPSCRERRGKRNAEKKLLYIQTFPASATAEAAARAAHKKAQRQQCIQEIILFHKSQRVVKSLAEGALPEELVLMVMQKLVEREAPITDLEPTG